MGSTRALLVATWGLAMGCAASLGAQVQTEVPPAVPGARPATVERVKIHGAALEGNLEGDAVDRDTIVFLPPSYASDQSRRYPIDGIANSFEVYPGTHTSGVADRFQNHVLTFFGRNLCFEAGCR